MFTGIIEEIGAVESLVRSYPVARLTIRAAAVLEGMKIGDSISVDGVCLTVVDFTESAFAVEVQEETLKRTSLGRCRQGTHVNLERAVTPRTRLGGHYVQGHVDATGVVRSWHQEGGDWILRVNVPGELMKYIVPKGFIAINGISLTVTNCRGDVEAHIIPHTRAATNLQYLAVGEQVNVEVDVLAKYVESLMR